MKTRKGKKALVINHNCSVIKELIDLLNLEGYSSLKLSYNKLRGVKAENFNVVFSAGGKTKITNSTELKDELRIWKECQEKDIPLMGICHGAQIGAYYSGGKYSKLRVARKGIFDDYKVKKDDPILKGIKKLVAIDWHEYGINSVGKKWDIIMTDSTGEIQIAKHKNSRVYLIQFHPELKRPKKGKQKTNAELIINNFLKIVKE